MKRLTKKKVAVLDREKVFLGHYDKKITGKRIDFRTGLQESVVTEPLFEKAPFLGRGWEFDFFTYGKSQPELMISADDFISAYRGLQILPAALLLIGSDYKDIRRFESSQSWETDVPQAFLMHERPRAFYSYERLVKAAQVSAKASHKKTYQYALYRLLISKRICDVDYLVTHSKYGEVISNNPYQHAVYSQAIVAAYGAIEELNLHMKKVENNRYSEAQKQNLMARLQKIKLNGEADFYWLKRSPAKKIENAFPFDRKRRVGLQFMHGDDCLVSLIDAIHRAGRLRNKVSAHKFNDTTAALSAVDVLNLQNLARLLILASLRCIDEESLRVYTF